MQSPTAAQQLKVFSEEETGCLSARSESPQGKAWVSAVRSAPNPPAFCQRHLQSEKQDTISKAMMRAPCNTDRQQRGPQVQAWKRI